ncbi:MAG: TIGR03087 family PEP-CTERM/XrtA system glycosyltransferase, partial [Pseudomonadota bacterium]
GNHEAGVTREPLLLRVHRIPFPPDKGDKIRSFRILEHLSRDYDVHLGCFIDDPDDWQHVETLSQYCASVKTLGINRKLATLRSARGLLTGLPLSVPFYASRQMQRWVDETLDKYPIRRIVAYSSPMAQFVIDTRYAGCRRIMDLVDVDSDKWRQYAERKTFPMRQVYRREWRQLTDYERRIADAFDAVTLVTENETELFDTLSPDTVDKHHVIANGVDTETMNPEQTFENPFPSSHRPLVFVGMMNYWANVEAVSWFAEHVLPQVRAAAPDAQFWIVGGSPTDAVLALDKMPGVTVTGRVEDVRPYIQHAAVALAPLRIARGIQNKVLEYLSMGRPTVCSAQAAAGLVARDTAPVEIVDSETETAAACLRVLAGDHAFGGERQYVLENYDWARNLSRLGGIVAGESSTPQVAARG